MDWRRIRSRAGTESEARPRLSDARASDGAAERDPQRSRRRRIRRRVAVFIFCSVFLAGTATALFGKGGYMELRHLRAECAALTTQVAEQRTRVDALQEKVERLKLDPLERERIARERLGFQREGEITFLLPKKSESPQQD